MSQLACVIALPIGPVRLHASRDALTACVFGPDTPAALPAAADEDPSHPILREAARQLAAYFAGRLRDFDLPLAPEGTDFQRQVWRALRTIPFGETWSYARLARAIGRPSAVRAVGGASGRNPIGIFIPCHRVIGKDGSLTGYGGGLEVKRTLLELETSSPQVGANLTTTFPSCPPVSSRANASA